MKRKGLILTPVTLSAADHMADNSAIMTGRVHPHHSSISKPIAPIPATSNGDKDATEDLYTDGSGLEKSHLPREGYWK